MEGGSSTPDLSLIMELADFFGTSVDVLLGYRQQSASLASTLARLRALCSGKQYDEGRREAEKAVKQFPNSFDVIYQSAALMQMIGMEEGDLSAARRARSCTPARWSCLTRTPTPRSAGWAFITAWPASR